MTYADKTLAELRAILDEVSEAYRVALVVGEQA